MMDKDQANPVEFTSRGDEDIVELSFFEIWHGKTAHKANKSVGECVGGIWGMESRATVRADFVAEFI